MPQKQLSLLENNNTFNQDFGIFLDIPSTLILARELSLEGNFIIFKMFQILPQSNSRIKRSTF